MTHLAFVLLLLAPSPEDCLAPPGETAAATATFDGKTYRFRNSKCRDEFLSDPERYSQLYDALAELAAAGKLVAPPRDASLVPS